MKIEQAIKIALKNDWKPKGQNFSLDSIAYKVQVLNKVKYKERFYLDPLFWQALGRGLGWGTEMVMIDEPGQPKEWCYFMHCPVCGEIVVGEREECPNECETENPPIISWIYHWHLFIDHLAEGKSISEFFDKLT